MEDASHVIVYRRFFGVLLTVLPGLVLCYIMAAIIMAIVGDLAGAEFGCAAGVGAVMCTLVVVAWIFIGSMLERWTEEKSGMFLFGVSLPFILMVIGGFCGWFIWIEALRSERLLQEQEEARRLREGQTMLVIEAPVEPTV